MLLFFTDNNNYVSVNKLLYFTIFHYRIIFLKLFILLSHKRLCKNRARKQQRSCRISFGAVTSGSIYLPKIFGFNTRSRTGVGLHPLNSIGFLFLLCELDNEARSINIDYRFGISIYLILIDRDAKRNASTLLSASLSINMR